MASISINIDVRSEPKGPVSHQLMVFHNFTSQRYLEGKLGRSEER